MDGEGIESIPRQTLLPKVERVHMDTGGSEKSECHALMSSTHPSRVSKRVSMLRWVSGVNALQWERLMKQCKESDPSFCTWRWTSMASKTREAKALSRMAMDGEAT